MPSEQFVIEHTDRFNPIANAISDAINLGMRMGIEPDEVLSVAARVVADYGRLMYGNEYLAGLCAIISLQADMPLPEEAKDN